MSRSSPGSTAEPARSHNSVRSDNAGNFNVPIGAADIASGTTLGITVIAQDATGNQSAPVSFQVRRN